MLALFLQWLKHEGQSIEKIGLRESRDPWLFYCEGIQLD